MDHLDALHNTDWEKRYRDRRGYMKIAVAAIGAAGSLIGGVSSAVGASNAAGAQAAAAQNAQNIEQQQYQQNSANQQPFISAGQTAVGTIGQDQANGTGFAASFNPSTFINSPGYNFQLQQGQNAINSSAAATGGVLNGGTLKALDQYTTGLANTTYNQAYQNYLAGSNQQYNQLFGVAQLGEQGAASLGQQGTQSAANQGNAAMGVGNAQAAGDVGVANGINSAVGGITNGLQGIQLYQGLNSQSGYNGGQVFQGYNAGNSTPVGTQGSTATGYIPLQGSPSYPSSAYGGGY